ncbi:hypothetical protein [Dyadobacter fermentans]|uniref:hypothetical protein n=1 Tax=Dyadobacter fermentans TaxID=94254 RepID=UPI00019D3ADE|nr:hypothetical protein [Dyadobacter fermentans]
MDIWHARRTPEVKIAETGFFGINAQINAYLAKQLFGESINSRNAPGQYDAGMCGKVGRWTAETGKNRTTGAAPNFLTEVVVHHKTAS